MGARSLGRTVMSDHAFKLVVYAACIIFLAAFWYGVAQLLS